MGRVGDTCLSLISCSIPLQVKKIVYVVSIFYRIANVDSRAYSTMFHFCVPSVFTGKGLGSALDGGVPAESLGSAPGGGVPGIRGPTGR